MIRTALTAAALAALALAAPSAAQTPQTPPAETAPGPNDWRAPDPQDILVIDTNKGRIIVEITPTTAPLHAPRIRELTRKGVYDGRTFFRVIDGFMAQTGDPLDNGTGESDLPNLPAEFTFRRGTDTPMVVADDQSVAELGFIGPVPVISQSSMLMPMTADGKVNAWGLFCPGVAGMARGSEPDSANSQFFLMRDEYPKLEKRYTIWGRVISGLDVVRALKTGEPVDPPQDKMTKVQLLADMPAAERPKIRVIDPKGPWFQAEIARNKALNGGHISPCGVKIPVEVK
ncbi:peptidylprolyl isomerase [Phenylobacterium sp.]|uniref:peptidylprolyl isomerase n=1 Tax=Phenylobacterium sp. TaxID=1871053 RepID=UPI0035ADA034